MIFFFEVRFFDSIKKNWPEWESYHAHALTTDLTGRTMRCAQWCTGLSDHEA